MRIGEKIHVCRIYKQAKLNRSRKKELLASVDVLNKRSFILSHYTVTAWLMKKSFCLLKPRSILHCTYTYRMLTNMHFNDLHNFK